MSNATKVRLELGARADAVDFRDGMYQQNLNDLPAALPPERFLKVGCPVLDQGLAMACTGYALATVANFLLRSRAHKSGDKIETVSPEMLYAMARRYDEYPGTNHQGSSIRGAVKGWHRHGVCRQEVWDNEEFEGVRYGSLGVLTSARAEDAATRPLGAYFRVPVTDLPCVHSALAEVGVMIAVLQTHDGWFDLLPEDEPGQPPNNLLATLREMAADLDPVAPIGPQGAELRHVDSKLGIIPYPAPDSLKLGLHAVAVIGYDIDGVWIQNSLGPRWGRNGIARICWDDWLENAQDAWVLRLGAPVRVGQAKGEGRVVTGSSGGGGAIDYAEMRPHIIPIGVDGRFQEFGPYATAAADVASILRDEFRMQTETWKRRRLLFIVSSGINQTDATIKTIAGLRDEFMRQEIYPILLLWNGGFADRIAEILQKGWQSRQSPQGSNNSPAEDMARLDSSLEALCRRMGGWVEWEHVKNMAERSVQPGGAIAITIAQLGRAFNDASADDWPFDVHFVGESSAAWLIGQAVAKLTIAKSNGGLGRSVATTTLCGPACTMEFFKQTMLPALKSGALKHMSIVTLNDLVEQVDGFGGIYHGSLLWLIANALEETPRIPPAETGTAMLGLMRDLTKDMDVLEFQNGANKDRLEHIELNRGDFGVTVGQLHGRLLTGSGRIHGLLEHVLVDDPGK